MPDSPSPRPQSTFPASALTAAIRALLAFAEANNAKGLDEAGKDELRKLEAKAVQLGKAAGIELRPVQWPGGQLDLPTLSGMVLWRNRQPGRDVLNAHKFWLAAMKDWLAEAEAAEEGTASPGQARPTASEGFSSEEAERLTSAFKALRSEPALARSRWPQDGKSPKALAAACWAKMGLFAHPALPPVPPMPDDLESRTCWPRVAKVACGWIDASLDVLRFAGSNGFGSNNAAVPEPVVISLSDLRTRLNELRSRLVRSEDRLLAGVDAPQLLLALREQADALGIQVPAIPDNCLATAAERRTRMAAFLRGRPQDWPGSGNVAEAAISYIDALLGCIADAGKPPAPPALQPAKASLAAGQGEGETPKRKAKRRRSGMERLHPITAKQAEATQLFGELNGNRAACARKMGITRQAFDKLLTKAHKKLGQTASASSMKLVPLRTDHRGQLDVGRTDRRRRAKPAAERD